MKAGTLKEHSLWRGDISHHSPVRTSAVKVKFVVSKAKCRGVSLWRIAKRIGT